MICKPGDVITVLPGVKHEFSSENGSIVEEISSTHYQGRFILYRSRNYGKQAT